MTTPLLPAILELYDFGLTVIPILLDGSKAPAVDSWRTFYKERPTREQTAAMFSVPSGVAVLGGPVSGDLEIIDFDRSDALPEWQELIEHLSPGLLSRLAMVSTPNGFHVYYRCTAVEGNKKLAMYRDDKGKTHTKIETRGTGGYVIAPPSPYTVHHSGVAYEQFGTRTLAQIETITPAERTLLLDAAKSLNEVAEEIRAPRSLSESKSGRPGDDFEVRATWQEIMAPAGWTAVRERGEVTHWRRPGKDDNGISATTGVPCVGGKLYVFSSNAEPLQAQRAYGKFSAYAWLHHGGDFSTASRALRAKGYGATLTLAPPPTPPTPTDDDSPNAAHVPGVGSKPLTAEELDRLLDNDKGAALCEPTFSRIVATKDDDAEWARIEHILRRHKAIKLFNEKNKKHTRERSKRKDASWKDRLIYRESKSGDQTLTNCATNHTLILQFDPAWDGVLAFDEFANQITTRKPPPFRRQLGRWGDADALEVKIWMEQEWGLSPSTPAICEAILLVSKRNAFNALTEYLDGLVDHGGESVLDTWLIDFFGAPDTPYVRATGAKWMIAAVARAYDPGCQVDTVLILEGKQGTKKSSVLKQLCPSFEWFTDGLSEFGSKAQAEEVEGKWIVELGEMKGFGKELEQIKAFITRRAENYRPAYARYSVHSPRKCVFAATVNPDAAGYLRDSTGNRRYWPIEVTKQAPTVTAEMRDRIWAEAVTRYKAGEKWYIENDELEQAAAVEQEKRVVNDAWQDLIEERIALEATVSVDEILSSLNVDKSKRGMPESMRVGRVLTALKWIRYQDRTPDGRRPWRYRNPKPPAQLPLGIPPGSSDPSGRHAA